MKERFIVIGGDAAGMSAASKARRENAELEIIVLEKGGWASYAACGLPYYLKGNVKNIEDLIAIQPEIFRKERNIDLRLNHEVTRINPEKKIIVAQSPQGEIELTYHKLLISTGAKAVKPKIKGIDSHGVFFLRDITSAIKIKEYLAERAPKSVLIVGGGYIGLEMAEAFYSLGMSVQIVELLPHLLNSFGLDIAEVVEKYIKNYVRLHLGRRVNSIREIDTGKLSVYVSAEQDKQQEDIDTEMLLIATGIVPEVTLAREAGIKLGPRGAIVTDEFGETNTPDIYAAGDCAEVKSIVTNQNTYIPLALTANRNGRAVGSTIGGKKTRLSPIAGTAVVKVFQLEVATTGLMDIEVAQKYGFNPIKITIDSRSRAGYCPGSKPIKISLMADSNTKKVLGCSMVGEEGVAKRIDIVATALYSRLTVEQLENLDLAYAPPFSPVWDPVLTAAKVLNEKLE
ncbi:MAG: FAD-dependent oxidoreductase [Atribacterota bacterium]|nr:FAD-dependent oxidoreductase [Atribacterota bacterium]MDD4895690.1 FAD-dependent oxidoreductase [Atribacterota bacterium]MDD5638156.1 FAD-dependent oxidoreductase [Atribacterota bacterium]